MIYFLLQFAMLPCNAHLWKMLCEMETLWQRSILGHFWHDNYPYHLRWSNGANDMQWSLERKVWMGSFWSHCNARWEDRDHKMHYISLYRSSVSSLGGAQCLVRRDLVQGSSAGRGGGWGVGGFDSLSSFSLSINLKTAKSQ